MQNSERAAGELPVHRGSWSERLELHLNDRAWLKTADPCHAANDYLMSLYITKRTVPRRDLP